MYYAFLKKGNELELVFPLLARGQSQLWENVKLVGADASIPEDTAKFKIAGVVHNRLAISVNDSLVTFLRVEPRVLATHDQATAVAALSTRLMGQEFIIR